MPPPIEWTPEMEQQLLDLRAQGQAYNDIALALGVSRHTVQEKRKALGLPDASRPPKPPQPEAPEPSPRARQGAEPIPAGHPLSWNLINQGLTSLEGAPYAGR